MKKYKIILLLFITPLFLLTGFDQNKKGNISVEDKWSGKVSWIKTSKTKGRRVWDNHGKEEAYRWDFFFKYRLDVNFVNSKGTVVRADVTTNWEKDSTVFSAPDNLYRIVETTKNLDCNGKEVLDLEVEFSDDKKSYWISFFTPACPEHFSYRVISNIDPPINSNNTSEHPGIQINLPANFTGQPVGSNPNALSGKWEETIPAPNDPGGGEIITRATWDLKRNK